jgi:hypothetical protein
MSFVIASTEHGCSVCPVYITILFPYYVWKPALPSENVSFSQLRNAVEQSPSWEADNRSNSQILRLLWNSKFFSPCSQESSNVLYREPE